MEKTYGIGLPRDMDRLLIPDSEYPVYPLKPGQEAYADVDGYRIKETIKKILRSRCRVSTRVNLYWGRIPGTRAHQQAMDFMASEYAKLGLEVRRQPVDMAPLWYPTRLTASYASGGKTGALQTMFPITEPRQRRRPGSPPTRSGSASAPRRTWLAAT